MSFNKDTLYALAELLVFVTMIFPVASIEI